jgi:hypothetical protein
MSEIRVVTMIDLEEIDLSAAPGTSARKIRAGKKNVAKILARGQSIPSWKRSLAALVVKKQEAGWEPGPFNQNGTTDKRTNELRTRVLVAKRPLPTR